MPVWPVSARYQEATWQRSARTGSYALDGSARTAKQCTVATADARTRHVHAQQASGDQITNAA